ncbi:MAG: 4Fe-4S dicluster domain-containing protein [Thermoplasmata archaeon]|nr:MAG: 4Fe-4S dicluster domain-containing protein [Thermoplasmata archaeon]
MKKSEEKTYSLFTGCLIPSKFPFIEKASRKVLEKLGVEIKTIEEASCCPNQMAIQSSDKDLWYVLAARNLCLAEKNECDILSLCNGCYDTLKSTNSRLKGEGRFRKRINERLAEFGLEFKGIIEVKHLIQVLHDDIGSNAIEKKVVKPLSDLKCACFEGCHVRRPMDHMGFDDPIEPSYLEDLVKVIGGECVSYSEMYSCCGGGLSIGRKDDVVPAARRILRSALEANVKALVVNCPFCFAHFFRSEKEINEIYYDGLYMPIFYITELLGLAFGLNPEELGLPMHYESGVGREGELVNLILGEKPDETVFKEEVSRDQLKICAECLACVDDCSTAMVTSEYNPKEILDMILSGNVDETLRREDIWYCMNCHECVEHCPQDFGMVKLIVRLKNMAVSKGIYPEVIGHRTSELHDTGYSFAPNEEIREEMGLPEIKGPKVKKLRKLMEKASTENSEDRGE